jgi:hypothetical protein
MVSKIEVDTVVNQSGDQDSGLDLALTQTQTMQFLVMLLLIL